MAINAENASTSYAMPMSGTGVLDVRMPPPMSTAKKFQLRLSEIFFPDDPLHKFKDQTLSRKFVLGLQYFLPILQWAPHYTLTLLKSDIISGLTIASLAIPQVALKFRELLLFYFVII